MPTPDPTHVDPPVTRTPAPGKPSPGTEYVVLSMVDDDGWREVARIVTSSATAAVTKHIDGRDLTDATIAFCAVPARSWQPVKPKPKVTTTMTLEPA